MKKYQVSILIPVYNASDFIEKCANSIFSQTFESIEYIFVDDASPDDSLEKLIVVLEKYPKRKADVKIIKGEKNEGISSSRQKAFDAATGDFFLAMDSDDWLENDMIELLYSKAIETHSEIVYCAYYEDFADKISQIVSIDFDENKLHLIRKVLMGQSAYWNKLVWRDLMVKNKVTTLNGVNMADDLVVLVKLIYFANSFAFVNKPLYHYVQYNSNAITKNYKPTHIDDNLKVINEVEFFLREKSDFDLYENSLLLFKALRKIKIIRLTFAEKKYLGLFPDIKNRIRSMNLPLKSKIILWLSAQRLHNLTKLFLKILSLLNDLKKKS